MKSPLAPRGNVYDFDAWHAAMDGEEAHEQLRQRRLNHFVDAQIDAAVAECAHQDPDFFGDPGVLIAGPLTIHPARPADPFFRPL